MTKSQENPSRAADPPRYDTVDRLEKF